MRVAIFKCRNLPLGKNNFFKCVTVPAHSFTFSPTSCLLQVVIWTLILLIWKKLDLFKIIWFCPLLLQICLLFFFINLRLFYSVTWRSVDQAMRMMYDEASWVKPQWPLFVFYVKSRQEISMKQIFIDVNVMTKYSVDFFVTKSVKRGGGGLCVWREDQSPLFSLPGWTTTALICNEM